MKNVIIPAIAGIPAHKIDEYNREFMAAYHDHAQELPRRRRRIVRRELVYWHGRLEMPQHISDPVARVAFWFNL